jgi:hypothetical protein
MSKKSLLEEGTVRRFMKLAGTQVLASDFLTETTKGKEDETSGGARGSKKGDEAFINEEADDEETPLQEQDELDIEAEEEDVGGEEIEDMEMDLEEPGADLEIEDEEVEEEEPDKDPEELVRDMVGAIADVAREYGVDVEVGEEEAPELEVPDMDMADEEEDITGELGPEGADVEEEEEVEEVGELEEINYIDEDHILNEVFQRVKKRLVEEKRLDEMASKLAKRIASRRPKSRKRRRR